jgi:molybdopterin-containing oxidoreductase family iron-sulfur binding subunit
MRYGMVIDLKRCIGCYGCQIFCKSENATPPGILWSRVLFYESGHYPNVKKVHIPLLCMHCADPPCEKVCPTGATSRRPDGIVTVDSTKCMGCMSCVIACPYRARSLHAKETEYFPGQGLTPYEKVGYQKHPTGVVEKCDFCLPRLEKGLEPACVVGCMAKARYFGDLDDRHSEVSQLIRNRRGLQIYPELGTDPSVYYLPP